MSSSGQHDAEKTGNHIKCNKCYVWELSSYCIPAVNLVKIAALTNKVYRWIRRGLDIHLKTEGGAAAPSEASKATLKWELKSKSK